MKVLKFGGTSVGSAERMKNVAKLIDGSEQNLVVLSAMSGTTNSLIEIANYLHKKNCDGANDVIARLESKYLSEVNSLYSTDEYISKGLQLIREHFALIRSFVNNAFSIFEERILVAQGELISTGMLYLYLLEQDRDVKLVSALDFMRIDENDEPDTLYIQDNIKKVLGGTSHNIYITQGFICRNSYGEIANLKRGGSDYSASLIGAAVQADEIQIWTDINGLHNNDPRFVENTHPVHDLSFDEAAELAYFGAKILHPTCVLPAKVNNIPVRLLNTMEPSAPGTTISSIQYKNRVAAIAAKDNITSIKIKSGRMLLAYGFLRKVFEIFECYKTPIDMITTSEVGVSVTIDDDRHLEEIVSDLKKYGTIEVESNQVIVCIVGDLVATSKGYAAQVFDALKDVPIHMISYGGSSHNISILIDASDKVNALKSLSANFFN